MKTDNQETENKIEEKAPSLWNRVKDWASCENMTVTIFTSHCCQSMWSLVENQKFSNMVNLNQSEDDLNGSDLMIIHGPVNPKKLSLIYDTYEKMQGKKYVLGVGSCLSNLETGYANQVSSIEEKIPFDIILPGCSIGPEKIIEAILALKEIR